MADNTRVNELQDKLLKAMDILNAQALNSISFDKTITCTIENDENKKDGKYEVNDGSIIFTAYSTDERYRNGDVVYVTIPQGNYENQKMIIGKKTSDIEQPFNFVTPFDSFFSMTGNLAAMAKADGLVANDISDNTKPMEECMTYTPLLGKWDEDGNLIEEGINVKDKDLIKYTRLGIKADFKSWIKNAVRGNYGLEIILSTEKQGTVEGDVAEGTYIYTLDSSNMYGNPYSFETFYNQELVLDIGDKDIGKVTNIRVNFYQAANFYDQFNEPIPSSLDGFKTETDTNRYVHYPVDNEQGETIENSGYYIPLGSKLNNNLFVQNLEIHFGYDISMFTNDYVEIYTADRNSYRRSTQTGETNELANKKNINMRWVHMLDGNPVDMVMAGDKYSNYEVRWYRYRVGAAAADSYCGIYWERMYVEKQENNYLLRSWKETDIVDEKAIYGELNAFQNLIFNPDVNKQQEKIKAIVVYEGNTPYRSNELIFENEEQLPPSEEAQHIMSALNIVCDDGTKGNYFLYGQACRIKDQSHATKERTLSAYFDTNNDGIHESLIQDASAITWIFPNKNTMIELIGRTEEEKEQESIERKTIQPKYYIARNYNSRYSNNTIQCIYELNGVVYTTEIDLTFGKTGTMGSDQTLSIDFVGDTVAYTYGVDQTAQFEIQLFDTSGVPQEIPPETVKWEWYYNEDVENKIINKKGNSKLELSTPNFNIEKLYILQATIGTLTTYFPIPIKNGSYSYIDGPTEVIYRSDGKPDYSDLPYKLYSVGVKDPIEDDKVEWSIVVSNEAWGYKYVGTLSEALFSASDKIYCTRIENYQNEDDGTKTFVNYTYTEQTQYDSTAIYYEKIIDNFIGSINEYNKLEPVSIYIKDAPVYGIKAMVDNTTVWSQPIFVCQNQYPSTVINQWDGKSLVLDEQNSAVIAAAVSAGRKNSDNTFSGVMMGDWSDSDLDTDEPISRQTGLYGFHHGDMSYAFKEDGTGFIGKSSMARINFDGSDATIYSAGYKDTVNNPGGMMINLYNNGEPFIELKSKIEDGKSSIMRFDTKNSKSEIKMTLSNNKDKKSRYIRITNSDSSTDPLTVGDDFSVSWEGSIKADSGTIGQWTIASPQDHYYPGALYSDEQNIILDPSEDGSIILNKSSSLISGGTIAGSILSSTSSRDSRIKLEGYFELNNGGYIGEMETGLPGNDDDEESPDLRKGVGMAASRTSSSYGIVKATKKNAGFSFGGFYATAQNSNVTIGGSSGRQFLVSNNRIALVYAASATGGSNWLEIRQKENGDTGANSSYPVLNCAGIPASNQFGIYARFA